MIEKKYEDMIEIIPTETLSDVLENILVDCSDKDNLLAKMKDSTSKITDKIPKPVITNPTAN